jgi:hypothetical protein
MSAEDRERRNTLSQLSAKKAGEISLLGLFLKKNSSLI